MKIFVEQLRPQGAGLTAYLHDKSPELSTASVRPAILIFPGGGYYSCSDREAEPIALAYLAEGYNAFVCRYSVGAQPLFADAFEDAQAAMALLHAKCEEWDIDKNKIAAVGFSAGGHLASAIGTMGNIRPAALILGYPVILENMGQLLGKEIPSTNERVDDKTPPTFIFATRDDDTVPIANTLAFTGALEKEGIGFELHVFRSGAHGLSLAKPHVANGLRSMHNPTVKQTCSSSVCLLSQPSECSSSGSFSLSSRLKKNCRRCKKKLWSGIGQKQKRAARCMCPPKKKRKWSRTSLTARPK